LTTELSALSTGENGTLTYRTAAGEYIGAKMQPVKALPFPARPDPPVLNTNYKPDYETEMIENTNSDGAALEYRAGTSGAWTTPAGDDNSIAFSELGWTGGNQRYVQLRLKATGEAFASEPEAEAIAARPAAPSGLSATVVGNSIEFEGFKSDTVYEYNSAGGNDWHDAVLSGLVFSLDNYNSSNTYLFRVKATTLAPASLPVAVTPAPIIIEAVDFGEKTYGYTPSYVDVVVRNVSSAAIDVSLDFSADSANFTLSSSNSVNVPANSTCSAVNITPATSLSAGDYTAKIRATYAGENGTETSEADVTLSVAKAEWAMPSISAPSGITDVTEDGFILSLTDNASADPALLPADTDISWRIGEETRPPTIESGNYKFSGLDPQTAYPVYITANGDTNHNESDEILLTTVYTAMETPNAAEVVRIDYINETLLFNTGYSPANYTVTVNSGPEITHMGPVTLYAGADFTLSVLRNAVTVTTGGGSYTYPASKADTYTVTGRAAAPNVTARYASTDLSEDGGLIKVGGGAFQYRIKDSGAGGWRDANIQVNTLHAGPYEARLAPTVTGFASNISPVIDVQWNGLAVDFKTLTAADGENGKTATTGLVITFDRDVTGFSSNAVTVSGAATAVGGTRATK
jgi:hypothetical protein